VSHLFFETNLEKQISNQKNKRFSAKQEKKKKRKKKPATTTNLVQSYTPFHNSQSVKSHRPTLLSFVLLFTD